MKIPGAILFDLDGVIFHDSSLIPGAKESIQTLHDAGILYRFVTNMTRMTKNNIVNMLASMGFFIDSDAIFAAPHAAVEYCKHNGFKKIKLSEFRCLREIYYYNVCWVRWRYLTKRVSC